MRFDFMDVHDYTVICVNEVNKQKTEYVFPSNSFHDCRLQALKHGLMGDKPLTIELEHVGGFITREGWHYGS